MDTLSPSPSLSTLSWGSYSISASLANLDQFEQAVVDTPATVKGQAKGRLMQAGTGSSARKKAVDEARMHALAGRPTEPTSLVPKAFSLPTSLHHTAPAVSERGFDPSTLYPGLSFDFIDADAEDAGMPLQGFTAKGTQVPVSNKETSRPDRPELNADSGLRIRRCSDMSSSSTDSGLGSDDTRSLRSDAPEVWQPSEFAWKPVIVSNNPGAENTKLFSELRSSLASFNDTLRGLWSDLQEALKPLFDWFKAGTAPVADTASVDARAKPFNLIHGIADSMGMALKNSASLEAFQGNGISMKNLEGYGLLGNNKPPIRSAVTGFHFALQLMVPASNSADKGSDELTMQLRRELAQHIPDWPARVDALLGSEPFKDVAAVYQRLRPWGNMNNPAGSMQKDLERAAAMAAEAGETFDRHADLKKRLVDLSNDIATARSFIQAFHDIIA